MIILTFVHEDYEYTAVEPNLIESTSSFQFPVSGAHTMYSENISDPGVGSRQAIEAEASEPPVPMPSLKRGVGTIPE